MDFVTQQINQTVGSEIPTHFLGRPLGRFSPVASAFCKGERNTAYFIRQHYLKGSVTRNSFPVMLSIIISLGWHQAPPHTLWVFWWNVILLGFLMFPSQCGRGMPCLRPRVPPALTHTVARGTEEHAHTQLLSDHSIPWGALAPTTHGACRLWMEGTLGTREPPKTSNQVFHRLSEIT